MMTGTLTTTRELLSAAQVLRRRSLERVQAHTAADAAAAAAAAEEEEHPWRVCTPKVQRGSGSGGSAGGGSTGVQAKMAATKANVRARSSGGGGGGRAPRPREAALSFDAHLKRRNVALAQVVALARLVNPTRARGLSVFVSLCLSAHLSLSLCLSVSLFPGRHA